MWRSQVKTLLEGRVNFLSKVAKETVFVSAAELDEDSIMDYQAVNIHSHSSGELLDTFQFEKFI